MWQPVLMINGYLISVLGLAMLIPAAVDMLETGRNWSLFVTSSIVSLFIGLSLFLGNRTKIEKDYVAAGISADGGQLGFADAAGDAAFYFVRCHARFCRCLV